MSSSATDMSASGLTPPSSSFGSIPEAHGTFAQSANAESLAKARQVGGDHYAKQAIQPWDIFDTWPLAERIGFFRGNALKYLMRLHDKDSPDMNARKAEHYCAKLAETLEADNG